MTTTIAAISSGQMPAAIGVIRMSGSKSLEIIHSCLHHKKLSPRMMHSRKLYDEKDEILDEVLVCYFQAPHSFTGEDCVEIFAHGGMVNLSRILQALYLAGAQPAQPGEFSRRAFINGKIDLARAEAIMDVIHAQNEMQCREAQRQLSGSVSQTVQDLRDFVMQILCAVEATIDFSQEEDLAPLPVKQLREGTARVIDQIDRMKRASEQYRSSGYRTVLMGKPNAGKSSLFNRLLGHERAIVTDIAGTTTDTLESSVMLGRHLFELIDTAGIVDSKNPIERIGVDRARDQIKMADIVVMLIDGNNPDERILTELTQMLGDNLQKYLDENRLIVVHTKSDLQERPVFPNSLTDFLNAHQLSPIEVSVKSRDGLDRLENALVQKADNISSAFENVTLMTSQRHIALLNAAAQSLERARQALDDGMPAEFIAADLHDAAQSLDTITGAYASEDIINEIFSHFCVGK